MAQRRAESADGGVSGWLNQRTGQWDLGGQDETTMQRQKYPWNFLVDHWFRMEFDGWENLPDPPVLLVGIHSGAPRSSGMPGRSGCSGGAGSGRSAPCTARPTMR